MQRLRQRLLTCASLVAMTVNAASPALAATTAANDGHTTTPIKHVIIIVGENRSFDHVFATYVPPSGTVDNLLSKGIVNADGTPGPHYALAAQNSAIEPGFYHPDPRHKAKYTTGANNMPPIMTDNVPTAQSWNSLPLPTSSDDTLAQYDQGLETEDLHLLTTGASGLPQKVVDTRITHAAAPANGPYQITNATTLPYDSFTGDITHRYFQMRQQLDCAVAYATPANPSGCLADLFPWVSTTTGGGWNGWSLPAGFNNQTTGEGSDNMGFYNVQQGDAPYLKQLADAYALGDNYHQPVLGGTGANSAYLGFASDLWYTNPHGGPATPHSGPHGQIENPDAQAGSNNFYAEDGYGGGSYVNCSDPRQAGVKPITDYLAALNIDSKCEPHHYYLVNNYAPGYNGDGSRAALGFSQHTIPPQSQRSIAQVLDTAKVSWTYYGEGWKNYVSGNGFSAICTICNPFQFQGYVMNNNTRRAQNLRDTTDLYTDLQNGTLPAVSWVKPGGLNDGHPQSSKLGLFEGFTKKILNLLQAKPDLFADTAVFITVDEGGGYYDHGYVQPVDFFGNGTRIPMIVVSPYSKGVGMVHSYGEHSSFLKFVEKNWALPKITYNSRDNLPNPVQTGVNPYVPVNSPAIDDLTSYFNFHK